MQPVKVALKDLSGEKMITRKMAAFVELNDNIILADGTLARITQIEYDYNTACFKWWEGDIAKGNMQEKQMFRSKSEYVEVQS